MGNNSSNLPVTEKHLKDLECEIFKVGLGEMQGWRGNMEDASLIHIAKNHKPLNEYDDDNTKSMDSSYDSGEFSSYTILKEMNIKDYNIKRKLSKEINDKSPENNISIIGVFDGHGGSFVSRFVAENFMSVFNNAWAKRIVKQQGGRFREINSKNIDFEEFKFINKETLEQIIIETFLDLDQLLLYTETQKIVHEYKTYKRDHLILNRIPYLLCENSDSRLTTHSFANHMGTTANVMFFYDNFLVVANVGDSMAVLFTEGRAIELNTEHKPSTPGEEERVNRAGLHIYNNRVDGKLNLTRAIGDLQFKNRKLRPHERAVTAYPEITTFELTNESEFVICACDGIWDCVEPQKLCEFVSKELKKDRKISSIIADIEDMVLSKTNNSPIGTDNMTCIIFKIN